MDITQKIDGVTKIGLARLSMGGIQPPPKSVKIELTGRCSLRCKFCALRTRKKQPKEDMDFEFFKRITYDMRMSGVEEIGLFFLGESFMAPHLLIEATRWCKRELEFPWVFLTTNGTEAYPKYSRQVMEAGLDSLKFSVNSYSTEQFRDLTGGSKKQFKAATENLQAAFRIRNNNKYKTILSASSILYEDKQKELIDAFIEEEILNFTDKHYWLPMYQMGMHAEKIKKTLGFDPTVGNVGRLDSETLLPLRQALPCWTVFTEAHVRVDGGLSACCFGSDEKFDMGMLDGINFMQQWNNKKFQALRSAHIDVFAEGPESLKGTPCAVCVPNG